MAKKNKFLSIIFTRGLVVYLFTIVISFIAAFLVTGIADGVLGVLSNKKEVEPGLLYTILCCADGIAAVIGGAIVNLFVDTRRNKGIDYLARDMGPKWEKRIERQKPMSIHTARFIVMLQFFCAIFAVVWCYFFTKYLKGNNLYAFDYKGDYLLPSILMMLSVPIAPIFFIRFCSAMNYLKYGYCRKCGAVFSFTYDRFLGTKHQSGTRHKTVTKNEQIGYVANGYGRIDIYGNVDHNYSQSYTSSINSYGCHCGFCGAQKTLVETDSHFSGWHEQ